jgi:hypothetical protein
MAPIAYAATKERIILRIIAGLRKTAHEPLR